MQASDYVAAAVAATGASARVLTVEEGQAFAAQLGARLGVDVRRRWPWDDVAAPRGVRRADGWQLIARHVGTGSGYLFFDDDPEVFEFAALDGLEAVLADCPPMEVYVCDTAFSYLLCHNHHDVVVGWGAATAWVRSLAEDDDAADS